jgi:hypothetical protein
MVIALSVAVKKDLVTLCNARIIAEIILTFTTFLVVPKLNALDLKQFMNYSLLHLTITLISISSLVHL